MTGIHITAAMLNTKGVEDVLKGLSGHKAREAYAKAINDTGFAVRRALQAELRSQFDRPTPFITKAPKLVAATPEKLSATIIPTLDTRNLPSKGGKVGVDPQHVLQAQEFGGQRADKRSEVVLKRARLLPAGMQTAIADPPFPGSDDGRGNLRGPFLTKLLSYLQAFGEQGFKSNVTAKSVARRKDMQIHTNIATRRTVMLLDGWEFFVSGGRKSIKNGAANHLGGRERVWEHTRRQNLAAGIWARQGKQLRMVVAFIKPATYSPRISMERVAQAVDVQNYLDRRVRFRVREAAGL